MKNFILLTLLLLGQFAEARVADNVYRMPAAGSNIPGWGAIDLTKSAAVTGALPIANGGTGQTSAANAFGALSPLTTKGDILGYSTVNGRFPVGTDGFVLSADSTQTFGLKWISSLTNPMTNAGDMIYGGASGLPTRMAAGSSGQIPISTGSTVAFGTLPGNATALKAPTIQTFTSGSGTYTLPTSPSPLYLKIRMVGAGGGASGNGAGAGAGVTGGNTTFGSSLLTANGGAGVAAGSGPGSGGTASLGAASGAAFQGASAQGPNAIANNFGASGASSPFGGSGSGASGGSGTVNGGPASTNSGSGGGAPANTANGPGTAGSAGGYVDALIVSPSSTYSYAVGAAGTGGAAGTSGGSGGAGGAGVIVVEEHYQ